MKYLIVVDMQNDFIKEDSSLAVPNGENITNNIVNFIKNFDGKVIFTKDTHDEHYLSSFEGLYLPVEHCIIGTKGHRIVEELRPYIDEVISKSTFGSFDLLKYFDKKIVDEFYICGVCTSICVVSNALMLRAKFPNIKITCLKDLCDDVDIQKHLAGLDVMESCQIEIKNTEDVL